MFRESGRATRRAMRGTTEVAAEEKEDEEGRRREGECEARGRARSGATHSTGLHASSCAQQEDIMSQRADGPMSHAGADWHHARAFSTKAAQRSRRWHCTRSWPAEGAAKGIEDSLSG